MEISFTPVDNQRLANLCGALDENLRSIESVLEISISRRGERFTLSGEPERTAQGAQVLEHFYSRAGSHLHPDDIQLGLVEVQQLPESDEAQPTLITRKGDLRGRTPRQAHMPLLIEPIRPTNWQLQERGRAFPPNYLHETWRDWLYWDVELEA